jgi:hypothetical protein
MSTTNVVKYIVRQGPNSDRLSVKLDSGELGYANDAGYNRLFVGDGVTAGGLPVASKFFIIPDWFSASSITILGFVQQNDLVYNLASSNLYALTGQNSSLSASYLPIL